MSNAPEQLELPGMEAPESTPASSEASEEVMEAWHNIALLHGKLGTLTVSMMHESELVSYIGKLITEIELLQTPPTGEEVMAVKALTEAREAGSIHPAFIELREVLNYIHDDKLGRATELFNKAQEQV